ncbi:hypothetical protein AC578_4984 [Pseudocercospora eumusae]|uniref:Uncharacterized protein n=1 Tax=Pseudocercospora eumusae TaxID=321146 RepID=A0A139H951_9PEZI|nr:hypothetical protein AC578_4984 [Pseudocercospora eumusae]
MSFYSSAELTSLFPSPHFTSPSNTPSHFQPLRTYRAHVLPIAIPSLTTGLATTPPLPDMHTLPRTLRLRQPHIRPPRLVRALQQQRSIQTQSPRLIRLPQRRFLSQIAHKQNGEAVRYQAVRFTKPRLAMKSFLALYVITGVVIIAEVVLLARGAGISVEVSLREVEDEKEEEMEDEEGDGYAPEDSLFIPLTWSRKIPRTFYKGSDPEWQEFVKIAKDKERHKKIQDELVQTVCSNTQKHPILRQKLGKDVKIGKYWLDISFPDGPPQEYERSGIEIGDGFVAWSQQRVTPEEQWRLMRALYPKAAFDSLWAASSVLAGINFRRIKQLFGLEGKDPFSPEERYRHALEVMEKQQAARDRKQVGGKAQIDPDGNASSLVGQSSSSATTEAPKSVTEGAKKLPFGFEVPIPGRRSVGGEKTHDFHIAMNSFGSTIMKQWNPKKIEPPRGTFVVQGLVEVRGARGRMLIDVQSFYDPKEATFVAIQASVRNFKRWHQTPKGGP